jgi:hypothetical protein
MYLFTTNLNIVPVQHLQHFMMNFIMKYGLYHKDFELVQMQSFHHFITLQIDQDYSFKPKLHQLQSIFDSMLRCMAGYIFRASSKHMSF